MVHHNDLVKYGIYGAIAYFVYKNVLPIVENSVSGFSNSFSNHIPTSSGLANSGWNNVATVSNPNGIPSYDLTTGVIPVNPLPINTPNGPAFTIPELTKSVNNTVSSITNPTVVGSYRDPGVRYNPVSNPLQTIIPSYTVNNLQLIHEDDINIAVNKPATNNSNYITGDDRAKLIAISSFELLPGQFVPAPPTTFSNWMQYYNKAKGLGLQLSPNDVGLAGNATITLDQFISLVNSKYPNPTIAGLGYLGLQQNNGWYGVI